MIGLVGLATATSAQVFTTDGSAAKVTFTPVDGSIPDLDANGITFKGKVSNLTGTINTNAFRINLNIAGNDFGANGDLYITITSPVQSDGTFENAILLNRPGLGQVAGGYSDNGMNISIYDGATASNLVDVHWYQTDPLYNPANAGQVTGVYRSDGRNIDPANTSLFTDSVARTKTLSSFQGINPNGDWSLFIADVGAGGVSKLVSWGLDFTPIPEPQHYAMVVGAGLMAFAFYRNRMRKTA